MKANKQFLLSIATLLLGLATVNCGGGGGGSSPATAAATAYGVSCGTNMLTSPWGCLPQCGPSSVIVPGTGPNTGCQPIPNVGGYNNGYPGGIGGTGNPAMCQGSCPPSMVSIQGGYACLPQNTCGPCYGYYQGQCYIGDYAHQYYGY
jgi:hypothetical protein